MARTSALQAKTTMGKPAHNPPVIDSKTLPRTKVWGESDPAVRWKGAFAIYGGEGGATASSTIVYEIEPGGHLGWHTTPRRRRSTSFPDKVSSISKTARRIPSAPAVSSSCPRRFATTSKTPARTR